MNSIESVKLGAKMVENALAILNDAIASNDTSIGTSELKTYDDMLKLMNEPMMNPMGRTGMNPMMNPMCRTGMNPMMNQMGGGPYMSPTMDGGPCSGIGINHMLHNTMSVIPDPVSILNFGYAFKDIDALLYSSDNPLYFRGKKYFDNQTRNHIKQTFVRVLEASSMETIISELTDAFRIDVIRDPKLPCDVDTQLTKVFNERYMGIVECLKLRDAIRVLTLRLTMDCIDGSNSTLNFCLEKFTEFDKQYNINHTDVDYLSNIVFDDDCFTKPNGNMPNIINTHREYIKYKRLANYDIMCENIDRFLVKTFTNGYVYGVQQSRSISQCIREWFILNNTNYERIYLSLKRILDGIVVRLIATCLESVDFGGPFHGYIPDTLRQNITYNILSKSISQINQNVYKPINDIVEEVYLSRGIRNYRFTPSAVIDVIDIFRKTEDELDMICEYMLAPAIFSSLSFIKTISKTVIDVSEIFKNTVSDELKNVNTIYIIEESFIKCLAMYTINNTITKGITVSRDANNVTESDIATYSSCIITKMATRVVESIANSPREYNYLISDKTLSIDEFVKMFSNVIDSENILSDENYRTLYDNYVAELMVEEDK